MQDGHLVHDLNIVTGKLFKVTVTLEAQKGLPDAAVAQAELARQ